MTRITAQLLSALFTLGCGSGAMATPDHGQWMGAEPGYGYGTAPDQPAPNQGPPPSQGADDSQAPPNYPQSPQSGARDQESWQNQDQDQDEDSETFAQSTGRGHLGVMVMGLTPELRQFFGVRGNQGVLIAKVEPNSAAANASLRVGDVLVRVGRHQILSGEDVIQALAEHGGGRLRLVVVRQGRPVRLVATMPGQRPSSPDQNQI